MFLGACIEYNLTNVMNCNCIEDWAPSWSKKTKIKKVKHPEEYNSQNFVRKQIKYTFPGNKTELQLPRLFSMPREILGCVHRVKIIEENKAEALTSLSLLLTFENKFESSLNLPFLGPCMI